MPGVGGSSGGSKASSNAIKAGEAFVEANVDDKGFHSKMKRMGDRIKGFGGLLRNIGLGAAGLGTAMFAPLFGIFKEAAGWGDDLNDAADRMDTTAEAVARLGYAAELSAASLEDVETANKKVTMTAADAAEGNEDAAKAFKQMGISAEDFLRLPVDERFAMIADTFEGVNDKTEQMAFLFQLFGKSAAKMLPLIKSGGQGLRDMFEEAERVGAVMSGDDAKKAAKAMDAWDKSIKAIKYTVLEVGLSFLGFSDNIEDSAQALITTLKGIREFIQANRTVIITIAAVAVGLIVGGGALAVFGFALQGLIVIIGLAKAAILALYAVALAPLTLKIIAITAAVVGLSYVIMSFVDTTGVMREAAVSHFDGIKSSFMTMFEGIFNALKSGQLELAMKIAVLGLEAMWQEGVVFMMKAWNKFKDFFVDAFHDAVLIIRIYWNSMFTWVKKMCVQAVAWVAKNVAAVTDKLGITTGREAALIRARDAAIRDLDSERDATEREIFAAASAAEAARKAGRMADLAEAEAKLAKLKGELDALAKVAKPGPVKTSTPGKPSMGDVDKMATRFGDAVRGTFGSADYKGLLGIGPASDSAKETAKNTKDMLKELKEIKGKMGKGKEFE